MSQQHRINIPSHTHCRICGRSIPVGKEFCSNECREKDVRTQQKGKKMSRLYTLFFAAVMIIIVVMTLFGGV